MSNYEEKINLKIMSILNSQRALILLIIFEFFPYLKCLIDFIEQIFRVKRILE
jgi:hypothetical protein